MNAPVWLSAGERRAVQQFAVANGWGVLATLRHAVRVAYMGGAGATLTVPDPAPVATDAELLCELCHAREAVWYIVPLEGGRGVECCAVCHTRQPADVLDMWRKRNGTGQEVGE